VFRRAGKHVTAIDYGQSVYFKSKKPDVNTIVADFNSYGFNTLYDCIWCSHCLEHQLDTHRFLRKIHSILKEEGILAITVPPLNELVVGGHVSFWNGGLLLYRLVLAGFDCRQARLIQYDYNVSVIIKKKTIDVLPDLEFDFGDIWKIRAFLPEEIECSLTEIDEQFSGNIYSLNW
jgi:SAM-dependent methyltransferase